MFHANLKTNKQAGFSLVELMVVVAIIGILAAMSVGQIGKQVAKARQSEVKANLAALYTAMKTFQGEYGQYFGDFSAIGYGVEGQVRYDVGFGANVAAPASYTTVITTTRIRLSSYCLMASGGASSTSAFTPPCTLIPTNGTPPAAPAAAAAVTINGFIGDGSAAIFNTNQDTWRITEFKALTNSTPGIP